MEATGDGTTGSTLREVEHAVNIADDPIASAIAIATLLGLESSLPHLEKPATAHTPQLIANDYKPKAAAG